MPALEPPAGEPSNESPPEPQSVAGGSAPVAGAPVKRIYWGIGAVLAALVAVGALFLTQPWSKFNKPAVAPAVSEVARPTAKSPEPAPSKPAAAPEVAEVVPPIAKRPEPAPQRPVVPQEVKPEPPKAEAPKTEAPRAEAPKAEVQAMPPKILNLEVRGAGNNVQLCYGVQNAASATITPTPGNVKPVAKECVPVTAGTTYTLTARNAAGIAVSRTLAVEAAASPPPAQLVAVPNAIGKSRADAVAELEKAGLEVRIVEDKLDPKASGPADSVVAQLPKGGEQLKAGGRVTLQVMPAQVVVATVPSTLPRAGDVWEYRSRSMWKNVEPRNYTHQINSVSEREVRETMSNTSGAVREQVHHSRYAFRRVARQRILFHRVQPVHPGIRCIAARDLVAAEDPGRGPDVLELVYPRTRGQLGLGDRAGGHVQGTPRGDQQ